MALERNLKTPEETIEALTLAVKAGKLSRPALLRELMKIGLEEQKRWKAIHHYRSGRVDLQKAAEIAGVDEDGMRALMER